MAASSSWGVRFRGLQRPRYFLANQIFGRWPLYDDCLQRVYADKLRCPPPPFSIVKVVSPVPTFEHLDGVQLSLL